MLSLISENCKVKDADGTVICACDTGICPKTKNKYNLEQKCFGHHI